MVMPNATMDEFEACLNDWTAQKIPYFFLVDFEMEKPIAVRLHQALDNGIYFDIDGKSNVNGKKGLTFTPSLRIVPPSFELYRKKFDFVISHLNKGNSYLTNLTVRSEISGIPSLEEVFFSASSKFKLYFKDQFVVFSPEIFVTIRGGKIYSHPMKGTINAALPDARNLILNDVKELAEHVTIVDLIRNDLTLVSDRVEVTRFRYVDEIVTHKGSLLQVSSEIAGHLQPELTKNLGSVLRRLLPAGSISGSPKHKTVEIIQQAEQEKRGYYTGIFGIYDGVTLESAVCIRFIERLEGKFYYRSGGGITTQSSCELEYAEALEKIYVPVN